MARSYTHIKQYYEEMEQMHQEGHSCREIGEKFGFTKEQVKECLRRPRRKAQKDFHADRPNQKWVTDISYIPTKQGTLYLSIIRDLFDLSIVAYKTSTRQSIKLVLDTVQLAMEKEEVTAELQLHSDQGFQYASQSYFALTTQYRITPSMSRRANPYDNAMAENFFSILKAECIRLYKPTTIQEAQSLIDEFIAFYNYERIQLSSKISPIQKRRLFA